MPDKRTFFPAPGAWVLLALIALVGGCTEPTHVPTAIVGNPNPADSVPFHGAVQFSFTQGVPGAIAGYLTQDSSGYRYFRVADNSQQAVSNVALFAQGIALAGVDQNVLKNAIFQPEQLTQVTVVSGVLPPNPSQLDKTTFEQLVYDPTLPPATPYALYESIDKPHLVGTNLARSIVSANAIRFANANYELLVDFSQPTDGFIDHCSLSDLRFTPKKTFKTFGCVSGDRR